MTRTWFVIPSLLIATVTLADAGPPDPRPVRVEDVAWFSPPGFTGVKGAWMLSDGKSATSYALRVRLEAGARIPPHTHPDTRYSTVLTGTLYVGFGDRFDASQLVAVPQGAVYEAPAGVPHFLLARDGPVEYQEGGVGPTGTTPVKH